MTSRSLLRLAFLSLLATLFTGAHPALADSSHARIIRLSVVQGDVRFARDVKGDPLTSENVIWETAEPNLPVRQGYVLATDKDGRAAVEFENGAMAFLSENSVLEFYDLSLEDGAKTTRLVLRQGTASFYINPGSGDYFSVTGGDFTVEANTHATFRLDNFDDGSVVNVAKGHVSVLRKNKTSEVFKGQTLSARAGDENSVSIGSLPPGDDFDRWVSGRIDSVTAATASAQQYVNSPYTAGLADLYTYGSWYPVAGYGNCWRPYGVGVGWSPFFGGAWFNDASIGSSFIGGAPWGWLPYHYGGWIFDPLLGWLWLPGAFGGYGYVPYAPVTGVFVRSKPGLLGIVPVHPLDVHGKTPRNLARGIFPVTGGKLGSSLVAVAPGEQWKTLKSVPRNTLTSTVATSVAAPLRTSRTVIATNSGARVVTLDHNSSIAYDPREHRFVNTNAAAPASQIGAAAGSRMSATGQTNVVAPQNGVATARVVTGVPAQRTSVSPAPVRTSVYVPRAVAPPPTRYADYSRGGSSSGGGGARFDSSSRSSSASSAASSSRSSAPSAPSGGGRPH
jgi:FecR protein